MSRLSRSSRPSVVRRDILAGQVQSLQSDLVEKVKNMAFAFDIDGVLAHGNHAIEEAKTALRILNGDNELGMYPVLIFFFKKKKEKKKKKKNNETIKKHLANLKQASNSPISS